MRELTEGQLKELYKRFPRGSALGLIENPQNLLVRWGWAGVTPAWVKKACEEARQQKLADGTIHGTYKVVHPSGGKIEMAERGQVVCVQAPGDQTRAALLLGNFPDAWFIAAWNATTGEAIELQM